MKQNSEITIGGLARFTVVVILLTALLLWGLVLNVNTGSVSIPAGDIFRMLWNAAVHGQIDGSTAGTILFRIRLPRVLLAAVLGGALSVSGFLLQTFFRNPIAGPFVLGISSGAKMVVGITVIFLAEHLRQAGSGVLISAAFLGSLLITGVVLLLAQRVKNMSMLLVIGIMVGYICNAVTDFCVTFADEQDIANLTGWSMGSFSGADWESVKAAVCLCVPCLIGAWLLSKPIGAYALGEGYARSLGIAIRPFRVLLILLSSLLSACVTALAGPISFVGIAVPHITRSVMKTARPALVIPATFLCGSVFCIFCDLIARTALAPTELAISTVTSAFGAPVVIYMMIKRRRQEE